MSLRQSCRDIWQNFQNIRPDNESESYIRKFFKRQNTWMRDMIDQHPTDPFWQQAGYIVAQLDGLYLGYLSEAFKNPSWVGTVI